MDLRLELSGTHTQPGGRVRGQVTVAEGGRARTLEAAVCRHDRSDDYGRDEVATSQLLHEGDLGTGEGFGFQLTVPETAHPQLETSKGSLEWRLRIQCDIPRARDVNLHEVLDVELPEGVEVPVAPSEPVEDVPPGVKRPHHATRSRPESGWLGGAAVVAVVGVVTLSFAGVVGTAILVAAALAAVVGLIRIWRGPRKAKLLSIQAPDRVKRGEPIDVTLGLGYQPAEFSELRLGLVLYERWSYEHSDDQGSSKSHSERALYSEWIPLEVSDPSTTLVVPPDSLPSADGENLRLRWELVAAGVRGNRERVASRELVVGL